MERQLKFWAQRKAWHARHTLVADFDHTPAKRRLQRLITWDLTLDCALYWPHTRHRLEYVSLRHGVQYRLYRSNDLLGLLVVSKLTLLDARRWLAGYLLADYGLDCQARIVPARTPLDVNPYRGRKLI